MFVLRGLCHLTLTVGYVVCASALGQQIDESVKEASLTAGLVIHVGTTDGQLESEFAKRPRVLVQGLALDRTKRDAARKLLVERGQYGKASVRWVGSVRSLPYADNLANLLVIDAERLGQVAPDRDEMLRVLCPGGVLLSRRAGRWASERKQQPADTDEWTHFDYDARGNAVSRDERVAPPNHIQWVSGIQPMALGDNPASFSGSSGIRIASGRIFSEWTTGGNRSQPSRYGAWLAYNGLPLWSIESDYHLRPASQTVAVADRLFMFSTPGETLVARNADTGEIVQRYDEAGAAPKENPSLAFLRVADGKIVSTCRDRLSVIDIETAKVQWTYRDGDRLLLFPSVDLKTNRVYVLASDQPERQKIEHRWPNARAVAIVCLDLHTGREVWRSTEMAGRHVGQIVPNGEFVGVFAAGGIGAGKSPFYANLRASDGKMLWSGAFSPDWNRAGYVMLWHDDVLYYADPWKVFRLDPKTGNETVAFGRGYNGRCMRLSATKNYFLHSFVAYVDRDFRGQIQSVARSACANSVYPGNGLLYFTPNTCRCFTMLRGHLALSPEPLAAPLDDGIRLERGGGERHLLWNIANRENTDGLLWEHATKYDGAPDERTAEVRVGDRVLSAAVHAHRLEYRDAFERLVWQFTADARISAPPVVVGKRAIFAAHDGYVYAVNLDDGLLAWRFLAAPRHRWIVVHGQLESSWPVYGVTLHEGKVCISAGHHPEIGGGIYVWGLEPDSGHIAWQRVLHKRPATMENTQFVRPMVPHSCTNGQLQSSGDTLSLPGSRSERFAFNPQLSNEKLRDLLESPTPAPKGNRRAAPE